MNLQKRHLTVITIAITLALTILGYAGQTMGRQEIIADSHVNRLICSHVRRSDPGTTLTARAKVVVKGHTGGDLAKRDGGQIG